MSASRCLLQAWGRAGKQGAAKPTLIQRNPPGSASMASADDRLSEFALPRDILKVRKRTSYQRRTHPTSIQRLLEIPQTSLKYPTKMTLSLWRLECAAGPAEMVPCAVESALRRKILRLPKGREDHHCRSIPKSIQRLPKGLWVSPTCPAKMTLSLWFVGGVREGMDL